MVQGNNNWYSSRVDSDPHKSIVEHDDFLKLAL